MSQEFKQAVRQDHTSHLRLASNGTILAALSQLQSLTQPPQLSSKEDDARASPVAIAVRSKPNGSAPKALFSHTSLSRTSSSENNSAKRIAIDLTISSDEGDGAEPAFKKARHADSHVARNGVAKSKYAERLLQIPGPRVTLFNDIDDSTPSTDFKFINEYVFTHGTKRIDKEFRSGCTCREENGRNVGCEYVYCECIDDSARGGELYGVPYYATGQKKGTLREMFLKTRYAIYECNELCNCDESCKTRVVQKGRQVSLEIFKTKNRGWGLRSPQAIRKGEFIDTYLGEVITDAEATRREDAAIKGKDSYLYSLDKFQGIEGEPDYIPSEELYVVDGEFMGGPTRFINHSCDPNCRQFVISMVCGDSKVYELAFFALEAIPANTELTFDYLDKDDEDDDEEELVNEDNVKHLEAKRDRLVTKCLCGSANCRKYLWL